MMTHRDARFRYPETTQLASAGEDSVLLQQIAKNGSVAPFQDAGFLNIYSYHGKNVFSEIHHRRITFLAGRSLDSLRNRESVLRGALRQYRLPEPYRVTARDGKVMFVQN